jgi:hypothetical protein
VKLSRWGDVLFIPVFISCVLGFFFFAEPYLDEKYDMDEINNDEISNDANIMIFIFFGLIINFGILMSSFLGLSGKYLGLIISIILVFVIEILKLLVTSEIANGFKVAIAISFIPAFTIGIMNGFVNAIIVLIIIIGSAELIKEFVLLNYWIIRKLSGENSVKRG